MSRSEDALEAVEAAAWKNVRPGARSEMTARVNEIISAAHAYARTAADAVAEAGEALADPVAPSGNLTGQAHWGPGFVHLAVTDGIACNNRAPIPASRITSDPVNVSCTTCRNSRKFMAARAVA